MSANDTAAAAPGDDREDEPMEEHVERYGTNVAYPNGRCPACGCGVDEQGRCYQSGCTRYDASSPFAGYDTEDTAEAYDAHADGCDNCGGEDHVAEVCPEFRSVSDYEEHVAARRTDGDLCAGCRVPEHEVCSLDVSCSCCRDTMERIHHDA